MALPDGAAVQESDWKPLETIVGKIAKEKQKFERLVLKKEDLLEMFKYNKYKQHIIKDKIPDGTSTTVYRNGPLIDLCRGPHVPDTGRIEAFSIMKNSASYFLGNQENDSLQRVYGVSFPDKKQMAAHKKFLEEAAKRDHRRIGADQELFFFDSVSPGSAFWKPYGASVYNRIIDLLKEQYWERDFKEVITPNIYHSDLWKQSGHWQHYKDDMFVQEVDGAQFGLKPMNCPAHMLMFGHQARSHRELPLRLADFGVLHRNEASGALTGLTRVRRFCQDDAHIFCQEDQIKQEIDDIFDFLQTFYSIFGMTFKLNLSTRPEGYMGEIAVWDKAEAALKDALDEFTQKNGMTWELNPGDGAFYGPKIDVKVVDCLNREWQCATAQLDFVQPENFSLEYMTAEAQGAHKDEKEAAPASKPEPAPVAADPDTKKEASRAIKKPLSQGCARPVVIHRAMAGSLERFTAILIEHYGGKWPFWLNPRQIMVIPVGKGFYPYAEEVRKIFKAKKMFVDVDTSGETLPKKIRRAQLAQYNFVFGMFIVQAIISARTYGGNECLPANKFVQSLVTRRWNSASSTSATVMTPTPSRAAHPLLWMRRSRSSSSSATSALPTTPSLRARVRPRRRRRGRRRRSCLCGSKSEGFIEMHVNLIGKCIYQPEDECASDADFAAAMDEGGILELRNRRRPAVLL